MISSPTRRRTSSSTASANTLMLHSTLRTLSERAFSRLFSNDCVVTIERWTFVCYPDFWEGCAGCLRYQDPLPVPPVSECARFSLLSISYLNKYKYTTDSFFTYKESLMFCIFIIFNSRIIINHSTNKMGNYIEVCCNTEYFMNESAIEVGKWKRACHWFLILASLDNTLRHQPTRKNPLNAGMSSDDYGLIAVARTAVSTIE